MLSEQDIKKMMPKILQDLGGYATKQQIYEYIGKNCNLDEEDDLAKSNSRNEPKYYQRVGNIISHANKRKVDCIQYEEGFELIKNPNDNPKDRNQYIFTLPNFTPKEEVLFDEEETDNYAESNDKKSSQKQTRYGRKIDWNKINNKRNEIGYAGERFVYESEKEFVKRNYPNKTDSVEWTSNDKGDGLGYDITSVCHDNPNKKLLIEVKSTTLTKADEPFDMSKSEYEFFQTHNNEDEVLELYRLYNQNGNTFQKKVYSQKEILQDFEATPTGYKLKNKHKKKKT